MIPYGYCKCGCGERTLLNKQTYRKRGWVKGEPRDFLRGHQGRVDSRERSFWSRVDQGAPDECWPWTATCGGKGYGRFKFRGVVEPAHRVAWELAREPIPTGLLACHHCDNPPCCNPEHLFIGTQKENLADRDRKGRSAYSRGSRNGTAKLTEAKVAEIRFRYDLGEFQRDLAREFGVSQSAISLIIRGKTWVHS